MAISFVDLIANSTGVGALDGDLVVEMPEGIAAGDFLAVSFETETLLGSRPHTFVPPGWTLAAQVTLPTEAADDSNTGMLRVYIKWADGTEGDTETWQMITPDTPGESSYNVHWVASARRGTAIGKYVVAKNNTTSPQTSWTAPTYQAQTEGSAVSWWAHSQHVTGNDGASTARNGFFSLPGEYDRVIASAGTASATTLTSSPSSHFAVITIGLRPLNSAPYAPTITAMTDGDSFGLESSQRVRFTFADPDSDLPRPEGQSGFNLRHRPVGDVSWTTISQPGNTNRFYDYAALLFDADDYEHQVASIDLAGAVGPYSASANFTMGNEPSPPAWVAPLSGAVVDAVEPVEWAAGSQDAYEIRRVADDGSGDPNEELIYWSSGAVEFADARTTSVAFPDNDRPEHLQIRVRFDEIWSPWASQPVTVLYDVPPVPSFVRTPEPGTASLLITITTPESTGEQPETVYHNVFIDDGDWRGEKRYATNVAPNGEVRYWTPRALSARSYADPAIRVESVGTNGGISST